MKNNQGHLAIMLSVTVVLVVWHTASNIFPSSLLPHPLFVFYNALEILLSRDFYINAMFTLINTFGGFFVAFFITNILAFTSSYSRFLKSFWQPFIFLGLSTPSLVVTFIAILLFGSKGPVGIYIISLILIPEMFQILSPAYKTLSGELKEMAIIYRISDMQYFKHIFLPQVIPFLFSATRMGISVGWKLAILVEVFTVSRYGIGYKLYYYFNFFSITRVFAWLFAFIAVMSIIEYGIILQLEKRMVFYRKK